MADASVEFILSEEQPINADFELQPDATFTADLKFETGKDKHNELYNRDLPDQHPMSAITGLESALGGLSNDITAEYNRAVEAEEILDNKIDSEVDTRADEITRVEGLISDEETRAKGVEQDLSSSIDSNHQAISDHVSNKNNPHEVTKAQVGLGNVDNTSDSDKPVSTATQTALDGKVDKTTTADRVYGTDSSGNQTTYDKGSFGQVDDVKVAGVSVVTNKVANLGSMASETASDYYTSAQVDTALSGKQDTISDLSTIRSNATQGKSAYDTIQTYGNIVTHNVSEFATSAQGTLADTALQPNDNISELTNNLSYQTATQVANSIAVETNNRELADNGLQSQIDAIVSSSDVFDIVGTYADLQAYDISTVPVNDIIKVLVDETHSGAATYYRCVESGGVKSWSYIGSEGAYYTKGEADNKFVPQTRTVNSKALSSDITLTASDVGALPDSTVIPTVNDATVTIQKNGSTVSTFTLNQSSNETVNITVPTDTGDLTNGAGFITGITSGDVTTALGYTPADDSGVVKLTGNQTVSGEKTFNDFVIRKTSIDQDTTTGTTEVATYRVKDTDGQYITSQISIRYNTDIIWRVAVQNKNSNWGGYQVNLNDDGSTTARINTNGTNKNVTTSTASTTSDWVATMGWVNNPATSTNVVHRSGNETIAGDKTFSNPATFNSTTTFTNGATNFNNGGYRMWRYKMATGSAYEDVSFYDDTSTFIGSFRVDNTGKAEFITFTSVNAPTPATSDNSTKIATTAFVKAQGYATTGQLPTIDQTYDGTSANAQSGVAIEGELANYVQSSSLATVATSGDYDDLINTPTVDQVYDGTSPNAQSGIAVASAISTKQDSATALTTTNTYYSGNTLYIG